MVNTFWLSNENPEGAHNERPALDAAIAFGLHSGRHWRGASEAECWVACFPRCA